MYVSSSKAKFLKEALHEWSIRGLLDEKTSLILENDIQVIPFDWKKAARYSFLISLTCLVIAVSSALLDNFIIALINKIFSTSSALKCLSLTILSALLFWFGVNRQKRSPHQTYRNEAIFMLGVLTTGGAIYHLATTLELNETSFDKLLLLTYLIYGAIGFFTRSILIWVFSLLCLAGWFGAETGYASGWGAYFLGMNYPLRFILFGGTLTVIGYGLNHLLRFTPFARSTKITGLLYLFIALWILSIFGNHTSIMTWSAVKQVELFHWSLLFAFVSVGCIVHGLRFDDAITKNFGLVFLLINLYTRFFEYFWNHMHKAIFFLILGVSFWALGTYAEKIWTLGRKP